MIYDKEIVFYIVSFMVLKMEDGDEVVQDFVFIVYDLFSVIGSNYFFCFYDWLVDVLECLQGIQIKMNIEVGGEGVDGFFFWFFEVQFKYVKMSKGEC